VDVILNQSRLRQSHRLWPDVNVLIHPAPPDLFALPSDDSYFLDEWFGDEGSSEFSNYTAHQTYYEAALSSMADEAPVIYAHVVRDESSNHIIIQYWALYFYNDWFNKHEGDWEMVEVLLSAASQPEWIVLSQHHGGTRRPWTTAQIEDGTHPVAYVALGSHANYFVGNEVYPNEKDVGNARIEIMDRTGIFERLIPDVTLIPDRAELAANPASWPAAEWLMYRGHWGEMAVQSDFSGPLGPADKGLQWEQPYAWGMNQPLDLDTWYRNRLRVEVVGAPPGEAEVQLTDERGDKLPTAEAVGNLAILHADPPASVVASINVAGHTHTNWEIIVTWPNPDTRQVTRLHFNDVQLTESGRAMFEIDSGGIAHFDVADTADQGRRLTPTISGELGDPSRRPQGVEIIPQDRVTLKPSAIETYGATWDAPDLVWMGHVLPIQQVGLGIIIALIYSIVPTLVFVGVLYWVDVYEKEPVPTLAAAFMWGAIPALAVALVVELFFRLPSNLIGPHALEAARLGLLAPVLEEVLKGAGVVFIYWRYRSEFDDVLDGMIYGAIVGFGFAMTANFLSYIGSFVLWGYEGLSVGLVVQRTLHAMDHGLYTAILGAGLGFARLTQKRWQCWILVAGALVLAIFTHSLRNLLAHSLVGLNILTVIVTGAGTLVLWAVAGWSLWQQKRCLRTELRGMIPESLYHTVLQPLAGTWVQWRALRLEGISAWRRTRWLHHLCAELAFKRMQARLFPEEPERAAEVEALREEIRTLVGYERAAQ
jgi:RsiW-degrading membrane proteinase PrsW (M82 family)